MSQTIRQKVEKKKTYSSISKGHSALYIIMSIILNVGISLVVYFFAPNTNVGFVAHIGLIISSILIVSSLISLIISYNVCDMYTLGIHKKYLYQTKTNLLAMGHYDLCFLMIEHLLISIVAILFGAYNVAVLQTIITIVSFLIFVVYSYLFTVEKFRNKKARKIIDLILSGTNLDFGCDDIIFNASFETGHLLFHNDTHKVDDYIDLILKLYEHTSNDDLIVTDLANITGALINGNYFTQLRENVCDKIYNKNNTLYYKILPTIIQQLSNAVSHMDIEQIKKHKVFQQVFLLIQKVEEKSIVHIVAKKVSEYYKNIISNSHLSFNDIEELQKEMFTKLATFAYVPDIVKQQNIYCLLMIIKDLVEKCDTHSFSLMLDAIYNQYNNDKDSTYIVIIAIQLYLYYLTAQGNANAKSLYDTSSNNHYGYNQNLVHHMQYSKGRYLQYFWKIVYLIKTYDIHELSYGNTNVALEIVISYFLSYFKVFALSNVILSLDRTNLPEYYNEVLQAMIKFIQNNECISGSDLDRFLEVYDIEFDKQNQDYIDHINLIDRYISDRYILSVFDSINSDNERLQVIGTERFTSRLMDDIRSHMHEIPFSISSSTDSLPNNTISQIIDTHELLTSEGTDNCLKVMTKYYVDTINAIATKTMMDKSKLRVVPYLDDRENLSDIVKLCEKYEVDSVSSPISKNIHIVSNLNEVNLQDFITFEYKLTKLVGIESPHYLFANSKTVHVCNYPKSCVVRELNTSELTEILDSKKIRGNRYHIENFVSTYEDAKNYYQKTKRVVEINFNLNIDISPSSGFVVKFHN